MDSLKSQNEQFLFIVTTKIENSTQLVFLPENIRKYLFQAKSFPIFSTQEVKNITKIANSEGTLYKILQKISFPINYDKNFIENEILSKPNLIQQAKDYISMLIFHFYLSFFQTYNHDIDDTVTILKSLLLIIQNKDNNNEKYQIYAVSCFTTIIIDKQFQINYSNKHFLRCISDFFTLSIVPQESLNVLHSMLEKIGNGTDNEDELSNVLSIVNFAYQKFRPFFSNQFISTLFLNLRLQLVNLNYIVLSFYSQLSETLNDQDSEMYIRAFPSALIPYYDKSLKNSKDELMNSKITFYDTYTSKNPQSVKVTLPLSFKEDPPILNINKFELESIQCKVFNVIIDIVKAKNKKFCDVFVEQIIATMKITNIIKYYELLAIYIHFLIQLSPISPKSLQNAKFLFEEPYFQNPILCEDATSSDPTYYLDPKISSIRFLIMNFLFTQDYTFIRPVFENFTLRKFIFPEFCYRCIYINEEFKNPELSSLLFETYQVQVNNNSEEGKVACLITIKNYINTQKLRQFFFDNSDLYRYVFSFINANPGRREFILEFITKYFDTCRNNLSDKFIDGLNHIFTSVCDICTNNIIDENLLFILDIIKFCTKIISLNNSLIKYFELFFDKTCFLLTKLPQNNPLSKLIFTHSFSLFSVHRITQNESSAIEASAISLFGLTPNLKKLIISLMGADTENQEEFIIKQPKAIDLLIRIFKDDPSIWSFLSHLCKFSPINSIVCHEGGVDGYILDQLLQLKKENDLKYQESEGRESHRHIGGGESRKNRNDNDEGENVDENEDCSEKEHAIHGDRENTKNGEKDHVKHDGSENTKNGENENAKHGDSEHSSEKKHAIHGDGEHKHHKHHKDDQIDGKSNESEVHDDEEEKDRTKVKDLLTLFYHISLYASSISIVNRYMSLLCVDPTSSRLSDYHMLFVKLIHRLAHETHKIPMTAFYEPQKYENIDITYDWTVSVWIFITDCLHCPLITATKDNLIYEVLIKGQTLVLNINNNKIEYQFDCQLPLYNWICITLKVQPQDTKLFINGEENSHVSHASFFIKSADFTFNSSHKLLLGSITIYNITIQENLYKKGPRRFWVDPERSLSLAVRPHIHNNQLETEVYISPKNKPLNHHITTKFHKTYKKSFGIMNFIDILCERCGIALILPLLAMVKMYNANDSLLLETLSIIHNLLLYRNNSQKKFREMNGIRVISHLLVRYYSYFDDASLLNYKVYSKLFEIFAALQDEKSKQKFLKYILVNLMIWVHASPTDVVKIMNFLAEQDKEKFWKHYKLNYSLTISAFRVYFSQNDYQNVPRFKGTEEELYQVRKDLIIFSRNFCDDVISNSDFLIVLSHLKNSPDMGKELDLLHFLEEIINTDYKGAKKIKPESKLMISYLLRKSIKTIFNPSIAYLKKPFLAKLNYKILCDFNLLIEIIKLFYDSLNQHFYDDIDHFTIELDNNRGNRYIFHKDLVYFLMRWISDSFIEPNFLDLLIPLINDKYPLLFPLASMISVSLGESKFSQFLKTVKLSQKVIEIDQFWFVWIIIGILEFASTESDKSVRNSESEEEEEIVEGIEFLLNNSPPNQWENIFVTILNFSLFKQYNQTNAKIIFLRSLSKRIDDQEKCRIFIKLAMYQIFLRKYENKLNTSQMNAVSHNINMNAGTDDEDNTHQTFSDEITNNNNTKIRSSVDFLAKQFEKQNITRRLSNFTSKDSYSKFVCPLFPMKHNLENQSESIDPKKNKKISMLTIDKLIEIMQRNITDFKCIEDVKSTNKGIKWYDLSLANRIVDMFLTFPSLEYVDEVLIVEAYRLKYSSAEDRVLNKYVISAIDISELKEGKNGRYSISYFNKICSKFNIKTPFDQPINNEQLDKDYRSMKKNVLNTMKDSYDSFLKTTKNVRKIFKYYNDELSESTNITFKQTIQDYLASVGLRMTKSKNKWNHLCASMMEGPETPWHLSIKQKKVHFRRDYSSCFCFCPFKMKVNNKYDQHVIASLKRSTGSQKTAEELYDKFLMKIKKKENHNSYYDLQESDMTEVTEERPKFDTDVSQYIFTADCQIIKVSKEVDACFMLSKDGIVIQTANKVKKYPLYLIKDIFLRDYLHRPTAIEMFLNNGVTVYLNFTEILNYIVTDQIQCQIIQSGEYTAEVQQCTSHKQYFKSKKITQLWCENKISNFEYLILLNIYSGRSFNNSSQYPFMPWIIFDYESSKINPASLRPLDKPIGAVNKDRLDKLLQSYQEKKDYGLPPFLYSSGPMCPLSLYYWMVRVEPFTTFHIEMQDGSFDHSDRVFTSWAKAKELITTMEDMYRELPPEAFFSHDFMVNYNEISLGIGNDKSKPGSPNSFDKFDSTQDVVLPPWAKNALEFVYLNRKVLESKIVSQNLNNWIDLIWGYKQTGPEAEKALNIYRPEMYHNIWSTDEGKDECNWPLIETYLSQVGQIPVQLFDSPHPQKTVVSKTEGENGTDVKPVVPTKIKVAEVSSFIGANVFIKRSSSNEAQTSLNYNLMKNEINVTGLNEDGEITVIKVNYKMNEKEQESLTTPVRHKKLALPKSLRNRHKSDSPKTLAAVTCINASDVSYNTEVVKKHYNLSSDARKKKRSPSGKKYEIRFTFLDDSKICYSDNIQNILILDDLKKNIETELLMNQNKIKAIAFDGDVTVAAFDSDGFLSILQLFKSNQFDDENSASSLEVLYTTPSFYERINCCDISKDFHQVVCGSSDGFLLIFSLSNQTFLRTIKLDDNKKPQFVMITKSWGFIFAVLTEISEAKKKTFLAVWTINGDFIRMNEIQSEISKVSTWRSKSGFDYFLFATPNNNIVAGEVFNLEVFFNYKINDDIISISYDYDLENAIVLSKGGLIWFIPCSAPPPEF